MLLSPHAVKSINGIEKIQLKMMVAKFKCNLSTRIICCYSPTKSSDETDLIKFYNELSGPLHPQTKRSNPWWRHKCSNK